MKFIIFSILVVLLSFHNVSAIELSQADLFWLTQNIYWESRCQPPAGQIKVAIVTLNRMVNPVWPDTIKGVVTQPKRFSWYWNGKPNIPENKEAWNKSKKIAIAISNIWEVLNAEQKRIYWYHRYDIKWKYASYYKKVERIGDHVFYIPKGDRIHPL